MYIKLYNVAHQAFENDDGTEGIAVTLVKNCLRAQISWPSYSFAGCCFPSVSLLQNCIEQNLYAHIA